MNLHIELTVKQHGRLMEHLEAILDRYEIEAAALLLVAKENEAAKELAEERLEAAASAHALLHLLAEY